MSEPHNHDHSAHEHEPASRRRQPPPEVQDTGSRALAEALRSSFFFVKLVMAILALAFVFAGARMVKPGERAVLLRLGVPKGGLIEPGLKLAFPPPIDEIVRIPIGEIQTVKSTVGWYKPDATPGTPQADQAPARPSLSPLIPSGDGYALTADTNIVHLDATLRYRVRDAVAYAFDFADASNVVQNVLNNAVMFAAAHTPLDQALKQPDVVRATVATRVEDLATRMKLGITIELAEVRIVAPGFVQPDIVAVNNAENEVAQKVNTAKGEADNITARARGDASALINAAKNEQDRYLRGIEKLAASYSELLPEYNRNPHLFRERLLTETWHQVIVSAATVFFIPDRADGQRELRLLINKDPDDQKPAQALKPGEAKP